MGGGRHDGGTFANPIPPQDPAPSMTDTWPHACPPSGPEGTLSGMHTTCGGRSVRGGRQTALKSNIPLETLPAPPYHSPRSPSRLETPWFFPTVLIVIPR